MNIQKIGALAVVMVLIAVCIGAFSIGYNTETESDYTNPSSSLYAKEYSSEGLTIINDYTNDNYTINSATTDNVGYIVSDKGIIDFRPSNDNVSIKYGTYTDTFTGTTYNLSATITNGTITPDIPPTTPIETTIGTPLTDTTSTQSGTVGTGTVTSMTLIYYQNTITITTNIGTKTVQNVDKLYLINKVLTNSEYYVYSGNITSSYYAWAESVLTYGTANNGYVYSGTTDKLGAGLTVTASATSSSTDISGLKKYMANSTPITIDEVSDQYTMLNKTITATNGTTYHTEYLIGGIGLILALIGIVVCVFRKD